VKPRIYIFQENMEHPLPTGIFVEMSNEFDDWTEEDFDNEIRRLRERIKELKKLKKPKTLVPIQETDEDDDDIMHDPDIREMVENGEHTCHMFDAPCQACEDDEDEDEEETMIEHVDKLRAHFC
jgi:hypothetical protein